MRERKVLIGVRDARFNDGLHALFKMYRDFLGQIDPKHSAGIICYVQDKCSEHVFPLFYVYNQYITCENLTNQIFSENFKLARDSKKIIFKVFDVTNLVSGDFNLSDARIRSLYQMITSVCDLKKSLYIDSNGILTFVPTNNTMVWSDQSVCYEITACGDGCSSYQPYGAQYDRLG
jgi:hypothetical protein